MSPELKSFLILDLWPLIGGVLAAVSCSILGVFLLLRRLSLMGDAISHSVLPGLVIAFLLASSRDPLTMFLGAAVSGVAVVVLVELVKRLGKVEPGAAMGVVFSIFFAAGVLLIRREADHIDLDAECVLHGLLEYMTWAPAPDTLDQVLSPKAISGIPPQIWTISGSCLVAVVFVAVFFKELRISAFDAGLADSLGFSSGVMHYALMTLVAGATVASFEAVGSILVIAMLICPAATSRLLTDRLASQLWISAGVAAGSAVLGYFAATRLPEAVGLPRAVSAAGGITTVSGIVLTLALVFAPNHGLLMRAIRRRSLSARVAAEDLLGSLYRAHERGDAWADLRALPDQAPAAGLRPGVVHRAVRRGLVEADGRRYRLTALGQEAALDLVRRHRRWETYLSDEVGVSPDHVHQTAELLEHLAGRPVQPPPAGPVDPHGRPVP